MNKLALTLATGMLVSGAATINAAPILNISGEGLASAQAAETAFLGTLHAGYLTETFDAGYTVGDQSLTINSVATEAKIANTCKTSFCICTCGIGITVVTSVGTFINIKS